MFEQTIYPFEWQKIQFEEARIQGYEWNMYRNVRESATISAKVYSVAILLEIRHRAHVNSEWHKGSRLRLAAPRAARTGASVAIAALLTPADLLSTILFASLFLVMFAAGWRTSRLSATKTT